MVRIKDVWLGDTLNISLNNGHMVFIPIEQREADDRRFREVLSGKCNSPPKTDGAHIYWSDGPHFSVEEIMRMVEG